MPNDPVLVRKPLSEVLVSAVLPVYNEVSVLAELVRRIQRVVASTGARCEIVFVNDGSTDGTPEVLDLLSRRHAGVRVIHFSRNFGHQAAVQAGLTHARGDVVVLMDSDMQDAPEAIGRMLAEWQAGYDVVYAIRTDRQERWWKRCCFASFHHFLAAIASTNVPANAGNFSLMDARVVKQIVELGEHDRYLPGLRSWVGFRQKGVEVRREARYDNNPRVSFKGLWRLAKTAVYSFSSFPLAIFSCIGYSALAVFLGLSGYSLFCKVFTDLAVPGWTSNVLVASFFGAVNALGISMLGEYVTRIYDQVRKRPLYLVERTVEGSAAPSPGLIASAVLSGRTTGAVSASTVSTSTSKPAALRADYEDATCDELLWQSQQLLQMVQEPSKADCSTIASEETATPTERRSRV